MQQSGFCYSKVNKRVTATNNSNFNQRLTIALLTGTMLAGIATPAFAQSAAAPPVAQAPALAPPAAPQLQSIRAITVSGAPRLEPGTVLSYTKLRVGSPYKVRKSTRMNYSH